MPKQSLRWSVVVAAAVLAASGATAALQPASAYAYPMPASVPVPCFTCPTPYTGLPTWPYSKPIKRFVGRYLDSSQAREIQAPIRTLRARDAKIGAKGRLYSIFGGSRFAAWNLDSFFTADLGSPLTQLTNTLLTTPELYLQWATYVDPDTDSHWKTVWVDGQQRLGMFDFDDRGFVYLPYGPYGWGIVEDASSRFKFVKQIIDVGSVSPGAILVMRSGTRYFAFVCDPEGGSETAVFDVTDPYNPLFLSSIPRSSAYWDKIPAGGQEAFPEDVVGVSTRTKTFGVYSTMAFATNANPDSTVTTTDGKYWTVTTDGSNFYVLRQGKTGYFIDTIGPARRGDPSSYALRTTKAVPGDVLPGSIRWGANYITLISTDSTNGPDLKLYKVLDGSLEEVDLGHFFQRYYVSPPAGYARPTLWTSGPVGAFVYAQDGHFYLIWEGVGIGDVYELERDTVSIDVDVTNGFGDPNPNAPPSTAPYYGDPITFSSVATSPMTLRWDFANPTSPDYTIVAASGVDVVHRFSGLATAEEIAAEKPVSAKSDTDATVAAAVPVRILVPSARIGVADTTLSFSAPEQSQPIWLPGTRFIDRSDGSVQGHFAVWNIDSNPSPSQRTPLDPQDIGTCGTHTLSFEARYMPYEVVDGVAQALPSTAAQYTSSIAGFTYKVAPFIAKLARSSDASGNLILDNATAVAPAAVFSATAEWTATLRFTDADGHLIHEQSSTLPVGDLDRFTVSQDVIVGAAKVDLTMTMDDGSFVEEACRGENKTLANRDSLWLIPRGDVNADGVVSVADVFWLISHLFAGGTTPRGPADVNADGHLDASDAVSLVNYLFGDGTVPAQ